MWKFKSFLLLLFFLLPITFAIERKFAYVAAHYEGTPKDAEYVYGLRVLIKSIQESSTPHDIVVLCSVSCTQKTIDKLIEEGAKVKIIPNLPNPYKEGTEMRRTYKSRFENTFNKLYLWNMTEYERVIYMDSDNIVIYNIDELFWCGHFCAVFMNPVFFHTGLMVVKPDVEKYHQLVKQLQSKEYFSYDGADQGFLVKVFPNMENAPMFDYSPSITEPLEDTMMRLPLGYNQNAVYYYAAFNWDIYKREPYHFSSKDPPLMTLGYPITPPAKPWNWWAVVFFDMNYEWQRYFELLPDSHLGAFMLPMVINLVCFVLIKQVCRILNLHPGLAPFKRFIADRARFSPYWVGCFLGFTTFIFSTGVSYATFASYLVPPRYGWTLFLCRQFLIQYTFLSLFAIFLNPSGQNPKLGDFSRGLPVSWMFAIIGTEVLFLYVNIFSGWHSHFVGKLAFLVGGIMVAGLAHIHTFRHVAEHSLQHTASSYSAALNRAELLPS